MGHIYNKSSHPIEVKRISVRVWSLRDEIEAALHRRIKECEAAGVPLDISDIKAFYGLAADAPLEGQPQLQLVKEPGEATDENVDAMMEAMAAKPEEGAAEKPAADSIAEADKIIADQGGPAAAAATPDPQPLLKHPYTRQAPDSDKISYGFSLLADVNMDWTLVFSKQPFIQGQSVVVEFLIPRPFMMSAEVVVCNHFAMRSRIISESKPDFRLQCRFTHAMAGERTRLREFLTSVEPTLPRKGAKKEKEADGEAGPLA